MSGLLRRSLVLALALTASCAAPSATGSPVALPAHGLLVWSADHETGDLSQWRSRQGGAAIDSGLAETSVVPASIARSGDHVLRLQVDVRGGTAGARAFRWRENPEAGYFGAWYYFPTTVVPHGWWNVMQIKSPDLDGVSQPVWVVNVATDAEGRMRLYLWDALNERAYPVGAARVDRVVETGRWVHLELYVERSTAATGRVALLQDGEVLFDLRDVRTSIGGAVHWSVNNYSDGATPGEVTIFVDDATIHLPAEGVADVD